MRRWKRNASTRSPRLCRICRPDRRSCGGIFDFDSKQARLAALNRELEDPKLWENPQRAQELGKEKKMLEALVGTLDRIEAETAFQRELRFWEGRVAVR